MPTSSERSLLQISTEVKKTREGTDQLNENLVMGFRSFIDSFKQSLKRGEDASSGQPVFGQGDSSSALTSVMENMTNKLSMHFVELIESVKQMSISARPQRDPTEALQQAKKDKAEATQQKQEVKRQETMLDVMKGIKTGIGGIADGLAKGGLVEKVAVTLGVMVGFVAGIRSFISETLILIQRGSVLVRRFFGRIREIVSLSGRVMGLISRISGLVFMLVRPLTDLLARTEAWRRFYESSLRIVDRVTGFFRNIIRNLTIVAIFVVSEVERMTDAIRRFGRNLRDIATNIRQIGTAALAGPVERIRDGVARIRDGFRAIVLAPITQGINVVREFVGRIIGGVQGMVRSFSEGSRLFRITVAVSSAIGRVLARLNPFILLFFAAVEAIRGAWKGFTEDGVLGAIVGAFDGLINFLIAQPIQLINNIIAWIADKLGFSKVAEMLRGLDFIELFSDLVDAVFSPVVNIVNSVISIFSPGENGERSFLQRLGGMAKSIVAAPFAMMDGVIANILGFFGFDESRIPTIGELITSLIMAPVNLVRAAGNKIRSLFNFGDNEGELPPMTDIIRAIFSGPLTMLESAKDWFIEKFAFDEGKAPDPLEIVMAIVRAPFTLLESIRDWVADQIDKVKGVARKLIPKSIRNLFARISDDDEGDEEPDNRSAEERELDLRMQALQRHEAALAEIQSNIAERQELMESRGEGFFGRRAAADDAARIAGMEFEEADRLRSIERARREVENAREALLVSRGMHDDGINSIVHAFDQIETRPSVDPSVLEAIRQTTDVMPGQAFADSFMDSQQEQQRNTQPIVYQDNSVNTTGGSSMPTAPAATSASSGHPQDTGTAFHWM